jgi:hypothetical protein
MSAVSKFSQPTKTYDMESYLFSKRSGKQDTHFVNQEWQILKACVVLLFLSLNGLYSQSVLTRPRNASDQDADGKPLYTQPPQYPWYVISDRDNNQLYKDPSVASTKLRTIAFNQVMYVLDSSKTGDFIQVVPVRDQGKDLFSAVGQPLNQTKIDELKGWIPIDHVVKFQEAQRQGSSSDKIRQHRWFRKGFIAAVGGGGGDGLFLYKNPDQYSNGQPAEATQYYFVFKQTAQSYLVGTSDRIGRDSEVNLDGWVPRSTFTLWPNNMAYEPNWDLSARTEFVEKTIRPYFFINDNIANCRPDYYKTSVSPPPGIERVEMVNNGQRMEPYSFRLFSLDYTDSYVKKIGNVADPTYLDQQGIRRTLQKDVINRLKEKIIKEQEVFKTVNMIFAIDGTNSFDPYWPSIASGIKAALSGMSERSVELGLNFKYGIIVYRDGASNSTNYPFSGLTADINRLSTFMSSQKPGDPEGGDLEGLFVGLNTLFDLNKGNNFFSPSNANYLFVIGDAGNRVATTGNPLPLWDNSINTVIDNLSKYYFNVIGIHVNCPKSNPAPYMAFKDQLTEIAKNVTAKKFPYSNLSGVFIDANNEIKIDEKFKDEFGCSGIIYSPPGQTIEVAKVTNLIRNTLTKISADVWKKEAQNLYLKLYPEPTYNRTFTIDEFRRIIKAAINQPGSTVVQFVETGYMRKQLKDQANPSIDLRNPLFYDVVMLSDDDLKTLRTALQGLVADDGKPAQSLDQMRRSMHENWINVLTTVLKLYSNKSPTDLETMNKLTLEELSKILTGTPGPTQFSKYRLSDILVNDRMPSDLFVSYLSSFVLTRYCIDILLSTQPVRPGSLPRWFSNYNRILRAFLVNSFGIAKPTPAQINTLINRLPERLNNAYFNLDKTKFTIPIDISLRQKKYEWVDCRVFPNDVTYQKLVAEIKDILKLP